MVVEEEVEVTLLLLLLGEVEEVEMKLLLVMAGTLEEGREERQLLRVEEMEVVRSLEVKLTD